MEYTVKGLPNIGSSCYFNSSIQLCKLISDFSFKDENNSQNLFITDIQSVFDAENNQEELNKYLRLYSFICQSMQYQLGTQQDACEVVQFIVDKYVDLIQQDIYKNKLICSSKQIITCLNCNKYRFGPEDMESMIISQELNNSSNEEIDFKDFLISMISAHNINELKTECDCSSPIAQVQTIFTNLPEYLFIKVGRCKSDFTKIYKSLKFEYEFDIDYPINLEKSIEGTDTTKLNRHYELIGIILHHGESINSGHYSSIVRLQNNWIYCDDMMIRDFDMNSTTDIEYIQKNCCLLLYRHLTN